MVHHILWNLWNGAIQTLSILQNLHSEPTRHRKVTHKFAQTANNWSLKKVQVQIIGTWCWWLANSRLFNFTGHSHDVIKIWHTKTPMTALSNSLNWKFIRHSCRKLQFLDEMVPSYATADKNRLLPSVSWNLHILSGNFSHMIGLASSSTSPHMILVRVVAVRPLPGGLFLHDVAA